MPLDVHALSNLSQVPPRLMTLFSLSLCQCVFSPHHLSVGEGSECVVTTLIIDARGFLPVLNMCVVLKQRPEPAGDWLPMRINLFNTCCLSGKHCRAA